MIQDIFPSRLDIAYKKKTPADDSVIMAFRDGKLLSRYDGNELIFPRAAELKREDVIYLFTCCAADTEQMDHSPSGGNPEQTDYFLLSDGPELQGYEYRSVRELRKYKTSSTIGLFAAFTAYHLSVWYDGSRFCGKCGARMIHDETERAMVCPECGNKVYPRINPAVIIGIRNKDKILITRYRTGYAHNALVAGFAEIGETLEDTVRREVMEEVGLKVKNITYYKSQPWGMALDLLVGFFCDVDGDDTIRMDEDELKYAEWIPRDEIELQPNNISLTNEMMRLFKDTM